MATRPHLLSMLPADLVAHLRGCGVAIRDDEARRVLSHVISLGLPGFPRARPVAGRIEDAITATTDRHGLEVVEEVPDPADGFRRLLLRSPDGALSEAVLIPLEKPGCYSVCLSSQVGCAMACAFCATGRLGLARNLEAWEMVAAFLAARERAAPGRVTGAVFMGQGEPLLNLDAVLKAAAVLSDPNGGRVKAEGISLSTVGPPAQVRRYAREGHRYRLVLSLTSAIPARRRELLPVAGQWPLDEVAGALREYAAACGERVSVAWVAIAGVNTGDDEVQAVRALLGGLPLRISVIEVNDPRPDGFRRPDLPELERFRDALKALGVPVVRRYSGGVSANAACGMLAAVRGGATSSSP